MLYIHINRPAPLGYAPAAETIPWHVGTKVDMKYDDVRNVIEVQADADELMVVLDETTSLDRRTIPAHRSARVQRWFGDDAKFIVANVVMKP